MGAIPSRLELGVRRPLTLSERVAGISGYFLTVLRRTWQGGVVSRLLTPVFFLAAMGLGVGSLVDGSSGGVDGVPYLQWVVPGLAMASVMQWAMGESTWPVMTMIRWNQVYAAMLAAPNRVPDLLLGHWLVIALGFTWGSAAFIGVAALFGGVGSWWALLGVPVAVLTGMAFVTPLFWIAARVENDESFTSIFRLVITPLMLFSGTFFPLDQVPLWIRPLAWATPLWHGTELARPLFLGDPTPDGWLIHVAVLLGYVAVGAVLARGAFVRRLAT